jgi:hypothetical protein
VSTANQGRSTNINSKRNSCLLQKNGFTSIYQFN